MNIVQRGLQVLLLVLAFMLISLLVYGMINVLLFVFLCMLVLLVLWRIPFIRKWILDRIANSAYSRFGEEGPNPADFTKNADSEGEKDITNEAKRLKSDQDAPPEA